MYLHVCGIFMIQLIVFWLANKIKQGVMHHPYYNIDLEIATYVILYRIYAILENWYHQTTNIIGKENMKKTLKNTLKILDIPLPYFVFHTIIPTVLFSANRPLLGSLHRNMLFQIYKGIPYITFYRARL